MGLLSHLRQHPASRIRNRLNHPRGTSTSTQKEKILTYSLSLSCNFRRRLVTKLAWHRKRHRIEINRSLTISFQTCFGAAACDVCGLLRAGEMRIQVKPVGTCCRWTSSLVRRTKNRCTVTERNCFGSMTTSGRNEE